jgi:ABC-type multidrug transport system fused ATPase/permease subunit
VGPSGAGKSTLAGVLLRLLPYAGGSVTLDGIELTELDGDEVRRAVGLVSQDAHVFDNTLEENLRLARREATQEQLDAALAAARLLDWTRKLPAGLQTEIGERGARMSGGQRQRLAIARALLADFPVLILDEPGEHLDTQTADAIVADLLAVTEGRTTLLITHRLTGLERWTRCSCSTTAACSSAARTPSC